MVIKKMSIATDPNIRNLLCYIIYSIIVNVYWFLYIVFILCVYYHLILYYKLTVSKIYVYCKNFEIFLHNTNINYRTVKIDWFLVFNATFSNISAISWRPILVVEEAGVTGENHRPWASNWSTLSFAAASQVHPFCNLQIRERTHIVLVIALYELLGNPAT